MNNELIEQPDTLTNDKLYEAEEVTPKDLLQFAKMILMVIASIFVLSMCFKLVTHDSVIFGSCKTILPPIATLVIGFYFGKSN